LYAFAADDLALLAATARRRSRSLREILEELQDEPAMLRISAGTRTALDRLLADLAKHEELARNRPAGEVLLAFLRDSGQLARLAGAGTAAAEEALGNVARFFEIVRSQSALLADDRVAFVAPHLATLVEAGDDPATADLDPDADAVAVLTVHKAKGLEFPVVFLPGLVAGRFPLAARREQLAVPVELVDEILPAGDFQLQEERRLFYVAMTRARDELILTHALDYGGARARRISPFVLEALDLPLATEGPSRAPVHASALERLGSGIATALVPTPSGAEQPHLAAPGTASSVPSGSGRPLVLSYSQIDAYLSCPLRYKLGHVIGVPVAPHHSLTYGSAMHKAVQDFHRRQGRGQLATEEELLDVFHAAWSNDGFLSREHEAARLEAGRDALRRFRAEQLLPGAVVPAYVEREFDFSLGGDRIRGRWDRVDIEPAEESSRGHGDPGSGGGRAEPASAATAGAHGRRADVVAPTLELLGRERVTITDYKTGEVRDATHARQRAKESLQLQIYAMAYEAIAGRLPDWVQLHFLDSGVIGRVEMDPRRLDKARGRIMEAASGIRAGAFDPTPSPLACTWCPFRQICPSSVAP
jgi:DNA helicase-2/ATP-dependent DNA helicase PcrA